MKGGLFYPKKKMSQLRERRITPSDDIKKNVYACNVKELLNSLIYLFYYFVLIIITIYFHLFYFLKKINLYLLFSLFSQLLLTHWQAYQVLQIVLKW